MRLWVCTAVVLLAAPALATGERVRLVGQGPWVDQFTQTLCVSMSCVREGDYDVTVSGALVKNELKLTVVGHDGHKRLATSVPHEQGTVHSMELVSATSAIVKAIESPRATAAADEPSKSSPAKKHAAKGKKKPGRLLAKLKSVRARG